MVNLAIYDAACCAEGAPTPTAAALNEDLCTRPAATTGSLPCGGRPAQRGKVPGHPVALSLPHHHPQQPYGPHNHELSLALHLMTVRLSPTLRATARALRAWQPLLCSLAFVQLTRPNSIALSSTELPKPAPQHRQPLRSTHSRIVAGAPLRDCARFATTQSGRLRTACLSAPRVLEPCGPRSSAPAARTRQGGQSRHSETATRLPCWLTSRQLGLPTSGLALLPGLLGPPGPPDSRSSGLPRSALLSGPGPSGSPNPPGVSHGCARRKDAAAVAPRGPPVPRKARGKDELRPVNRLVQLWAVAPPGLVPPALAA
jgi:hypothetical protein